MFLSTDILEFINKIVNNSIISDKENVKENINKFRDYLKLTKMADEQLLTEIDIIIECLEELLIIKNKIGYVDVSSILESSKEKINGRPLKKSRQSIYNQKHYSHYSSSGSSSCGGGGISSYRSC